MNDAAFRARLDAAAGTLSTSRWALAELARDAADADFPAWPERIGGHPSVRRSPNTVRAWKRCAEFRTLFKVGSPIYELPFDFHRRAADKLNHFTGERWTELEELLETAAAEGVTADAFGAELSQLCKPVDKLEPYVWTVADQLERDVAVLREWATHYPVDIWPEESATPDGKAARFARHLCAEIEKDMRAAYAETMEMPR